MTIDFGIDLGTTNSSIARFVKGEVQIYNNPGDFGRNSLPSVVAFKKDKIFVGAAAKTYYEKDVRNVVATFKRKMGTSETYPIQATGDSKSPVELSAIVLKELRSFVPAGENLDAVVITIPASFDTIQSNATKQAAHLAGFKQVTLLQEPIAASLAFANNKLHNDLQDGSWLVYDLGGGTFDVALVSISDGQMKVLDHEGDNYLGGADFDNLIVEKFLIPSLKHAFTFNNAEKDFKSAGGRLNASYYTLLKRAEEAKILLSSKDSADIIVDGFEDDLGKEVDTEFSLSRSAFEALIQPAIDRSISMVSTVLERNQLGPERIEFTLMVGGSSYIPFVRTHVEERLHIKTNFSIDPTSAIVIGAAYFASSKPRSSQEGNEGLPTEDLHITTSFPKSSREKEELFAAKIEGKLEGLTYRIRRLDGAFDSGLKALSPTITEDVPLAENTFNVFSFLVYDRFNNEINTSFKEFGINSAFGVQGQPLPEDICLEVDDEENEGKTRLLVVFERNTILPITRTLSRVIKRTVKAGSTEAFSINVFEGPQASLALANKCLGRLVIEGKSLSGDVIRGSDLELTFHMSESRDLSVAAYLNMTDQEFKNVFDPQVRSVPVEALREEIIELAERLNREISRAGENDELALVSELTAIRKSMEDVFLETELLEVDDVTDRKYQIDDQKRALAHALENLVRDKNLGGAKADYFHLKQFCLEVMPDLASEMELRQFHAIIDNERAFLNANQVARIQEVCQSLRRLLFKVRFRDPDFLIYLLTECSMRLDEMKERARASTLLQDGQTAIGNKDWVRLGGIVNSLYGLLPRAVTDRISNKIGF